VPKIDLAKVPVRTGTNYPDPHAAAVRDRQWQGIGDAGFLTALGVNLCTIPPGAWSSQMHVHTHEDEFVIVLSGTARVVTDCGEYTLGPGEMAAFPADGEAHHLRNEGAQPLVFLVASSRDSQDGCAYPGIDLKVGPDNIYLHEDGTPY
jgi:uncharacterized cupin superfamily protein